MDDGVVRPTRSGITLLEKLSREVISNIKNMKEMVIISPSLPKENRKMIMTTQQLRNNVKKHIKNTETCY